MDAPDARERVKVLFIMGMTRSGSTLLDNVLGEIDGFFSTGELRLLWKRGLLENRQCGCGARVTECDVWSSVLKHAYGEQWRDLIDAGEVVRWQRKTLRIHRTWGLLRGGPTRGGRHLHDYASLIPALYRSIAGVTGARVIVDSSKRPSDAALLLLRPELDVYIVHLVRDPRAVAFSWRRLKVQPDVGGPDTLARNGPLHSTLRWLHRNLVAHAVRWRVGRRRSLLLRYEDFVTDPKGALEGIVALVGEDASRVPVNDAGTVTLGTNHTVSGNPSRFRSGPITIRDDEEWVRRQAIRDRVGSTVLALPLLGLYGYRVRPGRYGERVRRRVRQPH
jgi:hypothetical protein